MNGSIDLKSLQIIGSFVIESTGAWTAGVLLQDD